MIKFTFKYNSDVVASIDNISKFSNKDVWRKFEEVVTQQIKSLLINELGDIRQRLEEGNVSIECNFNPKVQEFEFSYLAPSDLATLIESRIK
ncbi:MAG TPA: hypothetical protein VNS32_27365 [Flavisolibacter sp.]|nr:hypothetical protein [Flavisolibacter sp.]